MSSAKAIRKLKHIRQIKYALRLRELERERLAPIKEEKRETKSYILSTMSTKNIKQKSAKDARRRAREDFNLGPLRPNRAVGKGASTYGAMNQDEMRLPPIPDHWFGASESLQKRLKGRIPDNVMRDHLSIVEGDRVVILSGKDKNKVGVVGNVDRSTNSVTVEHSNMIWAEGSLFNFLTNQKTPKREWTMALPYDQVRLVAKLDNYVQDGSGRPIKTVSDCIVEAVDVEKHTTGINPFTGEVQFDIPEAEQIDPETEAVPYHRYVAGTRVRIPWPWENQARKTNTAGAGKLDNVAEEVKRDESSPGIFGRLKNAVGFKGKAAVVEETESLEDVAAVETDRDAATRPSTKPREHKPTAWEGDTLRNVVEGQSSWIPSLVMPPFPETVVEEIRESTSERYKREKESSEHAELLQARKAKKAEGKAREEEARQVRIAAMKTPLQIKWELDQAKKQKYDASQPPKVSKKFLYALGKHMAANGQQLSR
ncbi:hypothetical protein BU24DRAFT_491198 [Aaosphaeria arxii CBS 175.79]|uniref:KOW domain-containing protein n=1 Tax=Aaosphaeria arxii CBS 175.79 TaxID=1450172 RepID=A0A6A5XZN2_9PLEO|nr:uncharacterized protein BU24DRAFT_491198 [Aaosphaeria arxii CBS 175.79]KAF2018181.1 hypothetical protein BU24DRAFT_491198 [Aaosphaeria arxii CBS 175.79]